MTQPYPLFLLLAQSFWQFHRYGCSDILHTIDADFAAVQFYASFGNCQA